MASTRRTWIERYGADKCAPLHDVHGTAGRPLEWNDAAVEGSWKFLRRVGPTHTSIDAALRARNRGPRMDARSSATPQEPAARNETTLKQINFDFERISTTRWCPVMKMLNALEAADVAAGHAALERGMLDLLRALPGVPASRKRSGRSLASRRAAAHCSWRGLMLTKMHCKSDTIELVLQVNGKPAA